jgi:putative DNA modification/repair radical SAM protein
MTLNEKLEILSDAAKYDSSCSSSGSDRSNNGIGIGNGASSGICHSWGIDGRCISLLKILFTNYCIYDCKYCINRKSNNVKRTSFTVDEVISLTINFYKRNYIEGLFLSSGIIKDENFTMEMLYQVAKKLRTEHNFHGYIHLKAIPGADYSLIKKAGLYADRLSINIELPSEKSLKLLAPDKSKQNILQPMKYIGENYINSIEEKKKYKHYQNFSPAGQSTQLIVGATPETDYQIIKLSENLYNKFNLKRVYYSAYIPVNKNENLPVLAPPLEREHRLYQADWLIRFYNFTHDELLSEKNPNFNMNYDPKVNWALNNIDFFPLEVNKASYEALLRVPGIGPLGAKKIISIRRMSNINFEILKKIGIVLKRAKYFITCNGKYLESFNFNLLPEFLKEKKINYNQLRLF